MVLRSFFLLMIQLLISLPLIAQTLVLEDVSVLTMESDEIRTNQTVIIEQDKISWIGDTAEADIPDGAEVITGNYYVLPGLAEMHAHIPSGAQGEERMKDVLKLYLSQGMTTIRGMLGHPAHLELREQSRRGEIISPRIVTSGPSFSGGSVNNPDQARQMVNAQVEAGYDFLKLHPGLTLEQFNAISDEANRHGMEFSGHISLDVGLERALEAGQGTIDHLDRYMEFLAGDAADRDDPPIIFFGYDLTPVADEARIEEAVRMTKEAGTWNIPTNTLLENVLNPDNTTDEMRNWPGMEFIPGGTLENWVNYVNNIRTDDAYDADQARDYLEIRNRLTRELHRQNAGLLLGADAPQIFNPPGFSAHRELALLVDAGLSPFEALQTGTVNVGKYLGEEDRIGKVMPGYYADLLLLSVNPLESIPFRDAIEGVIYRGSHLDRAELDQLLDEIRARVGR